MSEKCPVVLRFAALFPSDLARYVLHEERRGRGSEHCVTERKYLNRPNLIGDADWIRRKTPVRVGGEAASALLPRKSPERRGTALGSVGRTPGGGRRGAASGPFPVPRKARGPGQRPGERRVIREGRRPGVSLG